MRSTGSLPVLLPLPFRKILNHRSRQDYYHTHVAGGTGILTFVFFGQDAGATISIIRISHQSMQALLGKSLAVLGLFCLLLGLLLWFGPKIPWLGRFPGDIRIHGERFSFYFPLLTCLIASAVLTILLNILLRR
jgi:hypothetical protein